MQSVNLRMLPQRYTKQQI